MFPSGTTFRFIMFHGHLIANLGMDFDKLDVSSFVDVEFISLCFMVV